MRLCNERLLVTRCKKKIIITIMAFLSLERYFCIGLFLLVCFMGLMSIQERIVKYPHKHLLKSDTVHICMNVMH